VEDVVLEEGLHQQDREQLSQRGEEIKGPLEVLFYGPLAAARIYRTFGWYVSTLAFLAILGPNENHCCLRLGDIQYHCAPKRGCFIINHRLAQRVMPATRMVSVEPPVHVTWWEDGRKFDGFRTLLWRWGLLRLDDSAMNCVTATCGLLGLPNLARTPRGLYKALTSGA